MSLSARFFGGAGGKLERPAAGTLFPLVQTMAVVVVALLFRLLFWRLAAGSAFLHTPVVDGSFFDIWARTLSEGRVFQAQPFFKPPLYAYLLSFLYRLGCGLTGVFVIQMLVGALSCALTLAVGRVVFSPRVAFFGALATALLPILPFFEVQLLAEAWTLALTLTAMLPVLLVISGKVKPQARHLALAGLLLGLAALGRPNQMLTLVVLAGCLWWWGRRGGRLGLTGILPLVIGFVIAISPATVHNLRHGEFALISANLGVNLYTGQSNGADGVSALPVGVVWDDIQLRSRQAGAQGPVAASRFLTTETIRWVGAHPGRTLGLWFKKAVLLCNGYEGRNNINPLWLAREDGVFLLRRWWPATWLLLPFAIVGLVWGGRGLPGAWLLRWVVLSQVAAILPFFVTARFRAPLLPYLALFAVMGVGLVVAAVRERRWVPLVVFVGALVLVNGDWYGLGDAHWLARDEFNQGLIHTRAYDGRSPDLVQAEAHFRQALALDPTDVDANERFGALLLGKAQPLVARGRALADKGEAAAAEKVFLAAEPLLSEARDLHRRATRLFPRSFRSWSNLATCQMWLADVQALRARARLADGRNDRARDRALEALGLYQKSVDSLQASLKVNRAQQDISRQMQMIWPAVLALPNLDPAIGQVQEQLRRRMEAGR